ncbi:hypothetical protein SAMN05421740_11287 [Parapedobacter koreensis]|uniref:Uncharacterized protein n=1 Tax=Parapedobacter koreensis TaxID=332977 RepID=A0A1H7TUJ6_9SPHI|nr:hypothetical protein SAMN05421740_11287 [Parapedobacter koreensis]
MSEELLRHFRNYIEIDEKDETRRNGSYDLFHGFTGQLNLARNSIGETAVFFLNSLLNDCAYSKPNW